MQPFGILFIIFGVCVFLYGVFIAAGHNPIVRYGYVGVQKLKLSKEELKSLGKKVEIFSLPIILTGISGLLFEEENITPLFVLIISLVITIIIVVKKSKKK